MNFRKVIFTRKEIENNWAYDSLMDYEGELVTVDSYEKFMLEIAFSKDILSVVVISSCFYSLISKDLEISLSKDNFICLELKDSEEIIREFIFDELYCLENGYFRQRLSKELKNKTKIMSSRSTMTEFNDIAKGFSVEKDINNLLDMILESSMKISSADAASIYIVVDGEGEDKYSYYDSNSRNKHIKFVISKNNSLKVHLETKTSPIVENSIVGSTVIFGEPINIMDAYNVTVSNDFRHNKDIDDATGYRTISILSIPMKDHKNRVIGVVQLINKMEKTAPYGIIPFDNEDELIIYSIAGQAAVALENSMLYKDMNDLLDKYKRVIGEAINQRRSANEELNKLFNVVKLCPISISVTDKEGEILFVNQSFETFTGFGRMEVMGKDISFLQYERGEKELQVRDSIYLEREWKGRYSLKSKSGQVQPSYLRAYPIRDESGMVKYFVNFYENADNII
ncbi:MAG TPA: PAS domain-containing protein [Clostridiaceae bacterium]